MSELVRAWRVWIDTGGTFTDAVAIDPQQTVHRVKILSTAQLRGRLVDRIDDRTWTAVLGVPWSDGLLDGYDIDVETDPADDRLTIASSHAGASRLTFSRPLRLDSPSAFTIISREDAPTLAARLVTHTPLAGRLPSCTIRLATTRGTNALLQRRGAPTALFTTRGFADLLRIGTQDRPDLFAIAPRGRDPLHAAVAEVDERTNAAGQVTLQVDLQSLAPVARDFLNRGISCAAVAFKNSYLNAHNEQVVKQALIEAGFTHVTASTDLPALIRLVSRAQSALVNATLAPIIGEYLHRIVRAAGRASILVMTSAGGLVPSDRYMAAQSLLSGPAGGVTGAALIAAQCGQMRVISFDMGGTSTDVARYDDDFEYTFEHTVGRAHLLAPALRIESIAAGGGSECWFDGHRLRIGPQSAGADPGPACYGRGGPFTLTDANLLLGRVDADRFQFPLDVPAARERARELISGVERGTGQVMTIEQLCHGCIEIANESMADAIRTVSLRRGFDPTEHALIAFGGAGGQHACGIADRLRLKRIIVPADSGLLSAVGLGAARLERFAHRQVLRPLDDFSADELATLIGRLETEATTQLGHDLESAPDAGPASIRRRVFSLRLVGQDATITIETDDPTALGELFSAEHERLFGYRPAGTIEIESIRVVASTASRMPDLRTPVSAGESARDRRAPGDSRFAFHPRETLTASVTVTGPALVVDDCSTTVVEHGWECRVSAHGHLVLTPTAMTAETETGLTDSSAVQRELFVRRFVAIVTDMGELLRRTARSTNIKERHDFSCAILDPEGRLVVNAPHIPVHLGAMGVCVRSVRESIEMEPGDTIMTNHPAHGGSHLPDITLITPVFDDAGGVLLGYVANRAHHAELGGQRAGSMPPEATNLAQEGVVIAPMHLVRRGAAQWNLVESLLSAGPYPSRDVSTNLADLGAALAANRRGAEQLARLVRTHGRSTIAAHMNALRRQAADHVREALERYNGQTLRARELLDDGSALAVTMTINDGRAVIDFTGSASMHPGNLNATPAIVNSVVMYALRLLVRHDIPLNEGLIEPAQLIIPGGSILNPVFSTVPEKCPAVVGGNVETSQRLVDVLLKALDLAGCSQGTMNNVLFGHGALGYYETIAGGAGATAGQDGASAIHTHMTNTRITDPEVLEHRYPVTVEQFGIRTGSGGAGRRRGGDGVVRELTFHAPMALSVLTQHRTVAPYGLHGGESGAVGRQWVERATGEIVSLGSIDGCDVQAGDRFVIHTPGGGGWGALDGGEDRTP